MFAQFADLVSFTNLEAAGFSAGGGLGMGVSPLANCLEKVPCALRACSPRQQLSRCDCTPRRAAAPPTPRCRPR